MSLAMQCRWLDGCCLGKGDFGFRQYSPLVQIVRRGMRCAL